MLNLLKSILTNADDDFPTADRNEPAPALPSRDREEAVPVDWAIASGDKSHAYESNFYGVFSPDGRTMALLIGEVSASGARATTLVNLIQRAIRSAGQEAAALQINRMLYEQDRYAAMFWSQFDPETRLLQFINAGHPPPLLFKANRRPMLRLDHAGPGSAFLRTPPTARVQFRSIRETSWLFTQMALSKRPIIQMKPLAKTA
jgi:hypothetical protein